ncbi:MAG: VWA domain-containing protein [Ardenticatenales bacterium]
MRYVPGRMRMAGRGAAGCCLAIVVVAFLLALGSCVGLGWSIGRLSAAPAPPPADGTDVLIVLDQSGSLFGQGGRGTDPDLMRMAGARLLVDYLGAEASPGAWRIGVVQFGTRARLVAPLTDPASAAGRVALLDALADPVPEGWTAISAGLDVAAAEAYDGPRAANDRQVVVVLFTDGQPQTADAPDAAPSDATSRALDAALAAVQARGARWITVLLAPADLAMAPDARAAWAKVWADVAAKRSGRLVVAATPSDLLDVYHSIAREIVGHERLPLDDALAAAGAVQPIEVITGSTRVKIVAMASAPDGAVELLRPSGTPVADDDADVAAASHSPDGRSSVWALDAPAPGAWKLRAPNGQPYQAWADAAPTTASSPAPSASPRPPATEPRPSEPPTTVAAPTSRPTAIATVASTRTMTTTAGAGASSGPADGPHPQAPSSTAWGRVGLFLLLGLLSLGSLGAAALVIAAHPGILTNPLTALRRRRPSLEGTMRPLPNPGRPDAIPAPLIPLDGRARFVIGARSPADVLLGEEDAGCTAELVPPADGAGAELVARDPNGRITVNGEPVRTVRRLAHGDDVAVGGWRARYENVMQFGGGGRTNARWDGAGRSRG